MLVFGSNINTRGAPQHGRTSPLPSSPLRHRHHHMHLEVSPSGRGSRHRLHPKIRVDIQGVTFYTGRAPGGPRWSWRGLAPRVASFCHATLSWPSIRPHGPSLCPPPPSPPPLPTMHVTRLTSITPAVASSLHPPPPPPSHTKSSPFHSPTHRDTPPGLIYTCYCLVPRGGRVTF